RRGSHRVSPQGSSLRQPSNCPRLAAMHGTLPPYGETRVPLNPCWSDRDAWATHRRCQLCLDDHPGHGRPQQKKHVRMSVEGVERIRADTTFISEFLFCFNKNRAFTWAKPTRSPKQKGPRFPTGLLPLDMRPDSSSLRMTARAGFGPRLCYAVRNPSR